MLSVDAMILLIEKSKLLKSLVLYVSPKQTIRVTRKDKRQIRKNYLSPSYIVTKGRPNYQAKLFIAKLIQNGIPVEGHVQYIYYPKVKK